MNKMNDAEQKLAKNEGMFMIWRKGYPVMATRMKIVQIPNKMK
jgi:hypothetical protein